MKALLFIPLLLVGLSLTACSGGSLEEVEPRTGVTEVVLADSTFSPRVIQVPKGTEVTWSWRDGNTPHDVAHVAFASRVLTSGAFTHTFTEAGTYDYQCTIHPAMTGRVVVEA